MMEDLFEKEVPRAEPHVLTVSELTRSVRSLLESEIGQVWVEGEISNYRRQNSGHQYFTLKDDAAQVACVLFFRPQLRLRQVQLADGMCVQVRGTLTVYEARGQYQLNVNLVQPAGAGLLQAKFEALKKKLEVEGLFDVARKRALPRFPTTIGIITSPTGAALRDMLNILQRRAPWIRILIFPVRVQGDDAAGEIARAMSAFNEFREVLPLDLLVVARGGGSIEDLWAFNEEIVARAIYGSEIPVVSAVGHEIDFTISDFVADLRAPTPSAAAELIAPDQAELHKRLDHVLAQICRRAGAVVDTWRIQLMHVERGALFREPARQVAALVQQIDLADEAQRRSIENRLNEEQERLRRFSAALREHRPDQVLKLRRQQLEVTERRIIESSRRRVRWLYEQIERAAGLLRVLAPQATLERGYSITTLEDGTILRSVSEVAREMRIRTQIRDGKFGSTAD